MASVVPWSRRLEQWRPHDDPAAGKGPGRPPIGWERMLRLYCLQPWWGLADEALADAVYDSQALRGLLGLDLGRAAVPDATTLLQFRHLLETAGLTRTIFATINHLWRERGLLMTKGTVVDATLIAAPPSTQNKAQARDPEMGHTRKGQPYYCGAQAHLGVDAASGLVHRTTTTAAKGADITATVNLPHGAEVAVLADAGYTGAEQRAELKDQEVQWYIATQRGKMAAWPDGRAKALFKHVERLKAHVRRRGAHLLHRIKDRCHPRQLRYQGLKNNGAQHEVLCALAHLIIVNKALLAGLRGHCAHKRGERTMSHPERPK
ncbi:MAG: IS5 family transposase [Chromatiaceae bacterium]